MTDLRVRAREAIAAKAWDTAAECLQQQLSLTPPDPELLQLAAFVAAMRQDYAAAIAHAEAWQSLQPHSAPAKHLLAQAYALEGRPAAAVNTARELVALAGQTPDNWALLAELLIETKDDAAAADAFRQVFTLDPSNHNAIEQWFFRTFRFSARPEIIAVLSAFVQRGDLPPPSACIANRLLVAMLEVERRQQCGKSTDRAESFADTAFNHLPRERDAWCAAAEAWYASAPRDRMAAENFVWATLAANKFKDMPAAGEVLRTEGRDHASASYELTRAFYAELIAQPFDSHIRRLAPARQLASSIKNAHKIFFIGCDQIYFETYGLPLLGSLARRAPDWAVHFHVFDPDERALRARFDAITARSSVRLMLTVENTPAQGPQRPIYYHAIRFVRFAEFQSVYGEEAWMIDADLVCNSDPTILSQTLRGEDIALLMNPARPESHNRIAAGIVGVRTTSVAAQLYLQTVAGYLTTAWNGGWLRWGTDQAALYLVMLYLADVGKAPAAQALPSDALGRDGVLAVSKVSADDPAAKELMDARASALAAIGLT